MAFFIRKGREWNQNLFDPREENLLNQTAPRWVNPRCCSNYQVVMPLSVLAKVINRFLLETKKEAVDFKRPGLQAAFLWRQRKRLSTSSAQTCRKAFFGDKERGSRLQAPRAAGRFSFGDRKLPNLQAFSTATDLGPTRSPCASLLSSG